MMDGLFDDLDDEDGPKVEIKMRWCSGPFSFDGYTIVLWDKGKVLAMEQHGVDSASTGQPADWSEVWEAASERFMELVLGHKLTRVHKGRPPRKAGK